ncbi:hypothetical protein QQF64_028573 [Cirrhinus molitorella]|uniref:Uncharacterized protein n=1 Tax=Cirrhinus molitorella TaxID=172907 RepID=A0ABR3N720_9TELE
MSAVRKQKTCKYYKINCWISTGRVLLLKAEYRDLPPVQPVAKLHDNSRTDLSWAACQESSPPGAPSESMAGTGTGPRWTHPDRKLQAISLNKDLAVLACQL